MDNGGREMKIKKLIKINEKAYSKAYRFFNGEKLKFMFIYTQALNGKKWQDKNKNGRLFGIFKSKEDEYTARALVFGKYKFSLIVMN
jgi:hypothetical protein